MCIGRVACCPLVSHGEYTDGTDKPLHYAFRYRCGQHNTKTRKELQLHSKASTLVLYGRRSSSPIPLPKRRIICRLVFKQIDAYYIVVDLLYSGRCCRSEGLKHEGKMKLAFPFVGLLRRLTSYPNVHSVVRRDFEK